MGSLKKELILPCMTCPLCNKLLQKATTITECLHTFCRSCIEKKLSDDEGGDCCPICNIHLGTVPLDRLRSDNTLQELRAKVFPYKRIKVTAPETVTPVSLPAKRKGDDSTEDNPESSRSLETLYKYTQRVRQVQDTAAGEPSSNLNTDNGRRNSSETMENRADQWKPVDRLMKAANRSKSENTGLANTTKNKELTLKTKLQYKNNMRVRRTKALPSQVVPSGVEFEKRNYPIWFTLVPSEGDWLALPKISASYIRIKDGNIPVSFIQKYLKAKLGHASEDEIEIKCMGQSLVPIMALNNAVEMWLQTTSKERVSTAVGSSAKEFVMVLGYARSVICLSD